MKKGLIIIPLLFLSLISCGKVKKNDNIPNEDDSNTSDTTNGNNDNSGDDNKKDDESSNTKPTYVQFFEDGLKNVNVYIKNKWNFTITFKYTDTSNEAKEIYFKFDGNSSTATLDKGICETNIDPYGLTYLANNKQYMYDDELKEYLYQEDTIKGNKLLNIYFYASYFQSELLGEDNWSCAAEKDNDGKITKYYLDSEGKVVYYNRDNNTLKVRDNVITISKASGKSFITSWIYDPDVRNSIKQINEIVITNVNSTKTSIELSDLENAIEYKENA